jgi:hypothetical protein
MPGLGILLYREKLVLFYSEFKAIRRRLGHEPDRLGDCLRLERVGNVLRELRAGGGVDGVGGSEGFEGSELIEGVDDQFWFGQNRDRVRLKAGAWSLAGFELAIEDNGGKGELGRLNVALKKISAGWRPVRAMRPMPFSR